MGRNGRAWCQGLAILNPHGSETDAEEIAAIYARPSPSEQHHVDWGSCNADIDPTTAGRVTVFVRDRAGLLPFEAVWGLAADGVRGVTVSATSGAQTITQHAPVVRNSWLTFLPPKSRVTSVTRAGQQIVEGCGYDSADSSMQCTIGK